MKEQFVTYEIALAMKELKFNKECLAFYDKNKKLHLIEYGRVSYNNTHDSICIHPYYKLDCSAPLWQQVIDWFRENYNIYIWIYYSMILESNFYQIRQEISKNEYHHFTNENDSNKMNEFTYYESREQAILKAIELCKKK